jgi:hypothetical protein
VPSPWSEEIEIAFPSQIKSRPELESQTGFEIMVSVEISGKFGFSVYIRVNPQ